MNWPAECVAVIPCLNEGAYIGALVTAVRRHLPNVMVVDDGSSDQTAQQAEAAGATVIRHSQPQGKGAALRAGWQLAREQKFMWALSLDGDGQHAPEDIPAFLTAAATGKADLVVGNRMGQSAQMPWLRRRVNQWMSRRLSAAAGISLPDSQCGFRLMRLDAWAALPLETNHFEVESEVLLGFVARGYGVTFVPVQVIYRGERSKINPLWDTCRWFRWWRRVKLNSLK